MKNLMISLPANLQSFVDEQLTTKKYKSASEYIACLVSAERKRLAEEKLVTLVQEADASGPADAMTMKNWQNIRRRALSRLAKEGAQDDL